MTVKVFRVVYQEQPFTSEELSLYDDYFTHNGSRRTLDQDGIRCMEDDYYTYETTTDEEYNPYINGDQYENFKNKVGEVYDMLLNGDIDFVEFN